MREKFKGYNLHRLFLFQSFEGSHPQRSDANSEFFENWALFF